VQAWKKAFGPKWTGSIRKALEHAPAQVCCANSLIKVNHAVKKDEG